MYPALAKAMRTDGFLVLKSALSEDECIELEKDLTPVISDARGEGGKHNPHGVRNLLAKSPSLRRRISTGKYMGAAEDALGAEPSPVKGLYFDKNPDANWVVPWHQDLTIALQERVELPGFANWTLKDGGWQVQPPTSVLEAQVTTRIHLDDCPAGNGALRVVPGSHQLGRLSPERIAALRDRLGEVICAAKRGDVLVMSPLLLHASPKAERPSQRRVVHVEYSSACLPEPLRWNG